MVGQYHPAGEKPPTFLISASCILHSSLLTLRISMITTGALMECQIM